MKERSRATTKERWADCALLLLGHGSADDRYDTVKRHAAALAARRSFADVRSVTLSDANAFPDAVAGLGARRLYIMPMFMSEGSTERQAVGEALDLIARERRRTQGTVRVCRPLGLAPPLADLIGGRAAALAERDGWDARATSVVLAAHGSSRDPASKAAATAQAAAVARRSRFRAVSAGLLEEAPLLADMLERLDGPAIVVGFFASAGRHAADDVPRIIAAHGRGSIRYAGAIGEDAEIPEVVLGAVAEADARP